MAALPPFAPSDVASNFQCRCRSPFLAASPNRNWSSCAPAALPSIGRSSRRTPRAHRAPRGWLGSPAPVSHGSSHTGWPGRDRTGRACGALRRSRDRTRSTLRRRHRRIPPAARAPDTPASRPRCLPAPETDRASTRSRFARRYCRRASPRISVAPTPHRAATECASRKIPPATPARRYTTRWRPRSRPSATPTNSKPRSASAQSPR